MDAGETTFRTLLNGRMQYRVPLFQRPYAWQRKHREQLWADVLELYEMRRNGNEAAQHFLGSIVTAPENLAPERPATFTLIDGQQRMTTLSVLLAALRDHVRVGNVEEADRIDALYLRNQYPVVPLDVFKVLPTQDDREEFAALMNGAAATGTSSGLRQTYRYFVQRLQDGDSEGEQLDLSTLEHTVLLGLSVVSITLGPQDNAYRVFESLNAKGLQLRQIDLIRNLFMMKLGAEQMEDAYGSLWLPMQEELDDGFEAFAHDYYVKDGTYVRTDATYGAARSRLENKNPAEVLAALEDMKWFADRWLRIWWPDEKEANPEVRAALQSLNRFGTDTPYPFLLNVYEAVERTGTATAAQLAAIAGLIESFLVRRMFLNVPTNQLNRLFIRLWSQVPHEEDVSSETRSALGEPSRRWPTDAQFREAFPGYPLYTDSRPDQRRLVLDRLEESYGHHEVVVLEELQVEHVMPQTLTDEWRAMLGEDADAMHRRWLHTPGNLTLTGYNPELSNSPWPEKREFYAASNVSMTRELAEIDIFNEEAIASRGRALAERAVAIWVGP